MREINRFETAKMIDLAREARERAYAPYSGFRVGACLKAQSGAYYLGCNIENAGYSPTICAERTAMFAAGANYPDVPMVALAIAGSDHGVLCEAPATPCGSCRQVMAEYQKKYGTPMEVILVGSKKILKFAKVDDILPFIFDSLHVG